MTKEEEIQLISKIKSGETHLYKELVESHSCNVYNLIKGVVANKEDAEEVAQDVFVKAYFSIQNFRGECSFSTWLYRIAYNMSISRIRQKKREYVSIDSNSCNIASQDNSSTDDMYEKEMLFTILNQALLQLDPKDKFLVLSFHLYGKSIKELMSITGLSESNVKVRLHRTRVKINLLINNRELNYG